MSPSALIFSPEEQYLQRLSTALQTIGLFTMTAKVEKEAMALLHDLPFDIAIVDEKASGENPEQLRARFRQINGNTPYVFLSVEIIDPPGEIRPEIPVRVSRKKIPEVLLVVSKIVLKQ
jgi:hypothetical protein